jgi:hypothetical protein
VSAKRRLSGAFDGLGRYVGLAVALVVLSLLMFLLVIQSRQDTLLWSGGHTIGAEHNGVVHYRVGGQPYSFVPDPQSNAERARVDVYYDKADPFTARLDSDLTRALDATFVVLPLILAAVLLLVGARRRARRRRSTSRDQAGFGTGLDPDFVRRQLDQLRRPQ